jgi:glycosyltransferase involved in cell wall biosynthesis
MTDINVKMKKISIVSPVYKAALILPELIDRIVMSLKEFTSDYEIILVDDDSQDGSWDVIKHECAINDKVIGIKLSRNFGQHSAITAGIDKANSEWIVVMDCDLQDIPEEIPNLYFKAIEGYDIVLARRIDRKDSFMKKLYSNLFFKTLNYLTGLDQDKAVGNFGIYNYKVINAIVSMKESIRYFPSMVKWVGFSYSKIDVKHNSRFSGKTTYNFKKLINLALDIILAHSIRPIKLTIKIGFTISALSFLTALIYFIKWLNGSITILGYSSLIISIWLLSGLILATLGIIGLYVAKTFEGVKERPLYVIDKFISNKILA